MRFQGKSARAASMASCGRSTILTRGLRPPKRYASASSVECAPDAIRIGVAWPTKGVNLILKLDHIPVDIAHTNIVVMVAAKKVASEAVPTEETASAEVAPTGAAPVQPAAKKAASTKAATKKRKPTVADA